MLTIIIIGMPTPTIKKIHTVRIISKRKTALMSQTLIMTFIILPESDVFIALISVLDFLPILMLTYFITILSILTHSDPPLAFIWAPSLITIHGTLGILGTLGGTTPSGPEDSETTTSSITTMGLTPIITTPTSLLVHQITGIMPMTFTEIIIITTTGPVTLDMAEPMLRVASIRNPIK